MLCVCEYVTGAARKLAPCTTSMYTYILHIYVYLHGYYIRHTSPMKQLKVENFYELWHYPSHTHKYFSHDTHHQYIIHRTIGP